MDLLIRSLSSKMILIPIALILLPNILTFITASRSEQLLLSKELRLIRGICIYLGITVYAVLGTGFKFESYPNNFDPPLASDWFASYANIILTIMLMALLICFNFIRKYLKDKFFNENSSPIRKKFILGFGLGMAAYYFISITYWYGLYINLLSASLIELYKLDKHYSLEMFSIIALDLFNSKYIPFYLTLVTVGIIYWIFTLPLIHFVRGLLIINVMVRVKLANGQTIHNIYILHPTFGKNLLFGDKPNYFDCDQTLAIPRSKIEYIEFHMERHLLSQDNLEPNRIGLGKKRSPRVLTSSYSHYRKIKRRIKR